MTFFLLDIAGYKLNFQSWDKNVELMVADRFKNFVTDDSEGAINISVHCGEYFFEEIPVMVLSAPFVDNTGDRPIEKNDDFWSIWSSPGKLFIKATFPFEGKDRVAIVVIPEKSNNWEIWFNSVSGPVDPLLYPLDGLILYYLTVLHDDLLIHASAVEYCGKGYMFSGVSGAGKSTMANLWQNAGARIIHDDRLIVRKVDNGYRLFNTPVYPLETPKSTYLYKLFLISHGDGNHEEKTGGVSAVSSVLSNCIQHNWNPDITKSTLKRVTDLCSVVPVSRLSFIPDASVVDFVIRKKGTRVVDMETDSRRDLVVQILSNGGAVKITAEGYSMYPTIKSGEKIIIKPVEGLLKEGDIVAVKKENRFIVHRIVRILDMNRKSFYVTRGDSNIHEDAPVPREDIVGKVDGYARQQIKNKRYWMNSAKVYALKVKNKIKKKR